ncbi:MAG: hypothetical protein Q4A92_06365 [Corynebacterium sp.]|nr:hypothetical protein [Corynebacterium sp.]
MSEKQLTVAELMERAAKEGRVEAPRRRRRSLEEGGVSVAELTGSIPVVKAVPADSRHSAEPIDAPFTRQPKTSRSKDEELSSAAAREPITREPTTREKPAEPEPKPDVLEESSAPPTSDFSDPPPWMTGSTTASSAASVASASTVGAAADSVTADDSDEPPWLTSSITEEKSTSFDADDDVPPWLSSTASSSPLGIDDEEEEEEPPAWHTISNETEPVEEEEETPAWLSAVLEEKEAQKAEQASGYDETPPWIITESDEETREEDKDLPPWLLGTSEAEEEEEVPPWVRQEQEVQEVQEQQAPHDVEDADGDGLSSTSTPSTDKTMIISVVNENDPVRLTTGAFEAITPDQAAAAAGATAGTAAPQGVTPQQEAPAPQTPPTPHVTATGVPPHAEETTQMPIVEDDYPDEYQANDLDETSVQRPDIASVIPMGGAAVVKEEKKRSRKKQSVGEPQIPGPAPTPGPSVADAETQVHPAVDTPIPDVDAEKKPRPLPVKVEADEREGKMSFLAIAGMTIVAIIVGVLLFLGFEMLWSSFSKWVVSILAVAVTGCIVGVVHALRTERDFLSMGLAGLAGLAMTFGPMAVANL